MKKKMETDVPSRQADRHAERATPASDCWVGWDAIYERRSNKPVGQQADHLTRQQEQAEAAIQHALMDCYNS